MAISSLIRTEIDLTEDIEKHNVKDVDLALKSVGQIVIDDITDYLLVGESAVIGESFEPLSSDYADREKGGDTTPNLKLMGALWTSLSSEAEGNRLIAGVDESEEDKADGHNNFSGKSRLPQRRFIPKY
jgi:hypothetical protein